MSERAVLVAEDLGCVKVPRTCDEPGRCWQLGHCVYARDETRPYRTKPTKERRSRIVDAGAIRRKMRGERLCRCGCGKPATDGHHILPRSLGGDDLEDNIAGLNHWCHMAFEFGTDDREEVGERVGEHLRLEEIAYVLGKRGTDAGREFLKRYYKRELSRDEIAFVRRNQEEAV